MSILFSTDDTGLTRDGSYFNPATDWTILLWVRSPALTGIEFNTPYIYGDPSYTNPCIYINWGPSGITAAVWSGAVLLAEIVITADHGQWRSIALTYTASTTTFAVYVNGMLAGSDNTCDISTLTFVEVAEYLFTDTSTDVEGGLEIFNVRTWQNDLSAAQILAENFSTSAVLATNLLTDTPLTTNTDLADDSGNGRNWANVSTAGTSQTTPTLIGTATNISFATALDIGTSFPLTIIQNARASGSTVTLYYKWTPAFTAIYSVFGFGKTGSFPNNYTPDCSVFDSAEDNWPGITGILGGDNKPVQFPVVGEELYYLKFTQTASTQVPAYLVLSIEIHESQSIPNGSILINNDTNGFEASVLSASEDYEVLKFLYPFVAGEDGDILASGRTLFNNRSGATFVLYSPPPVFSEVSSVATGAAANARSPIRTHASTQKFYVGINTNPVAVRTIDSSGAFGALNETLTGITAFTSIAVNANESILYFCNYSTGAVIQRWDLVNHVVLSDLVAGISGYFPTDIIVLSDDTILVSYYKPTATQNFQVKHYDTAGVVLNTYDYGTDITANTPSRMGSSITPGSFVVYYVDNADDYSYVEKTVISSGAQTYRRKYVLYDFAGMAPAAISIPLSLYGPSNSCPVIELLGALANSGLYIISGTGANQGGTTNPIIRHDVDWIDTTAGTSEEVEIPDPHYDIFLAGDE